MCGEVDVDFEVETHAIASLATLSWAGAELRRLPEFSMSEIAVYNNKRVGRLLSVSGLDEAPTHVRVGAF